MASGPTEGTGATAPGTTERPATPPAAPAAPDAGPPTFPAAAAAAAAASKPARPGGRIPARRPPSHASHSQRPSGARSSPRQSRWPPEGHPWHSRKCPSAPRPPQPAHVAETSNASPYAGARGRDVGATFSESLSFRSASRDAFSAPPSRVAPGTPPASVFATSAIARSTSRVVSSRGRVDGAAVRLVLFSFTPVATAAANAARGARRAGPTSPPTETTNVAPSPRSAFQAGTHAAARSASSSSSSSSSSFSKASRFLVRAVTRHFLASWNVFSLSAKSSSSASASSSDGDPKTPSDPRAGSFLSPFSPRIASATSRSRAHSQPRTAGQLSNAPPLCASNTSSVNDSLCAPIGPLFQKRVAFLRAANILAPLTVSVPDGGSGLDPVRNARRSGPSGRGSLVAPRVSTSSARSACSSNSACHVAKNAHGASGPYEARRTVPASPPYAPTCTNGDSNGFEGTARKNVFVVAARSHRSAAARAAAATDSKSIFSFSVVRPEEPEPSFSFAGFFSRLNSDASRPRRNVASSARARRASTSSSYSDFFFSPARRGTFLPSGTATPSARAASATRRRVAARCAAAAASSSAARGGGAVASLSSPPHAAESTCLTLSKVTARLCRRAAATPSASAFASDAAPSAEEAPREGCASAFTASFSALNRASRTRSSASRSSRTNSTQNAT